MADIYPYNDDLLVDPDDQARARAEYPDVAFALIFPELLEVFAGADAEAIRARQAVRLRGCLAIGLIAASLIMASAAPLLERLSAPWPSVMAIVAAVLGVLGGVIAFLTRSRRWLEARLVAESLRQLHFRLLIDLAPDLLEAASSKRRQAFEAKRKLALHAFEQDIRKRKGDVLDQMMEDPEVTGGHMAVPPAPTLFDNPQGAQLLEAYRALRLLRQRQYADHKLRRGGGIVSKYPRAQAATLGWVGLAFVGGLFVLHVGAALTATVGNLPVGGLLDAAALSLAVVALAIRALEEGLKPRSEIERYRHYQAVARRLLELFDEGDVAAKLRAIAAMERASFDEMAIFLRAHGEARFNL